MKLTKSFKKVWAYMLVVAMVVASLAGYQAQTISADVTDWSALAYAGDGAGGGNYSNLYKVYCDDSRVSLVNIQNSAVDQEAGLYVTFPAAASECSLGAGNYSIQGAGVWFDLTAFTARETAVTVTTAAGTFTCYVYYENGVNTGELETPVPTTEAPYVEGAELLKETGFVDGSVSSWNEFGADYVNNGDGSVSVAVPAKTEGDNWSTQLVQNGLSVVEGKWYVAKYTVTSDVDKTFQLLIQSDGAAGGDWSAYAEEFTAVKAGDTVDVELKFQATKSGKNNVLFGIMMGYVQETASDAANVTISNVSFKTYSNDPATTPEVPTTEEVTTEEVTTEEATTEEATTEEVTTEEVTTEEATTEEVTTEEVTTEEVTTEEVTTEEATPAEMTFEQCVVNVGDDQTRHEAGNYKYYVGEWNGSTAQIAVDPANPDHIKAQQLSSLWYDAWGFQIEITKSGFEAGKTYTIQVDMEASEANGTFKTNASDDVIDVVAGVSKLTRTVEADENGNVNITFGLGWVGTAVVLDFSNVVVAEAGEVETTTEEATTEEVTTEEATTEAATTEAATTEEATTEAETTTAAATTTEAATTVAATTAATTTTAAVTTTATADKAVKAPGKAKVKKVTAKKKASKTVKLTLKKVKGAKGYQVQISKAKKFTKKNILVKKIVKKVKPAIKSKKLKGQKKLFVRARAYVLDANGKKVYGKWSVAKKVKIK